ncbi:MAG: hypothetical protein C0593_13190 [Marinilabiliales bacterium]|nr:MAG: hypothetical protein C0593_13190 [Marinilabiliales bacterium]
MKRGLLVLISLMVSFLSMGQHFSYEANTENSGFKIKENKSEQLIIDFSLSEFSIAAKEVKGENLDFVSLPGNMLPSEAGNPDLPSQSCFIAIPKGATVSYTIESTAKEYVKNKNIAPAKAIPFDTEEVSEEYIRNPKVYEKDALYPTNPVVISEVMEVRGISMVQVGVTPFQYNPATKELQVLTNVEIKIEIEGGKGTLDDQRLRSPWFEPILQDMLVNYSDLPKVQKKPMNGKSSIGYEYLIVVPNDPAWLPYAEQIREFRNQQGILTGIVTLSEIGGNTATTIEAYIDNAYNNWDIPPVAVLLMADYGSDATNRITSFEYSHPYSGTYITDNTYADVTGNSLPDIIFARMAAEDVSQLEVLVSKVIEYETNPPTDPSFYASPVTALGWQTERWFQICSEVIGGFMQTLGKTPVRINEIYSGTPGTTWSTATNTSTVVNYFGPDGLGYIPATPDELGNWSGGNATMISNAINSGSFMVVHRDHGGETLWGEPSYSTSHINALTNDKLPFVFSLNCLTGKFNRSGECFAEAFHRHTYNGNNSGALGLIAASQVSYSFVNDTYAWGMFDNFFPDFMPDYGMSQVQERGVLPAFGNASGKYFLQQSNWPYNTYNKEITYNLFHHHGDAFSVIFTEVPQNLAVTHNSSMLSSASSFDVIAPEGSLIGLSVNGELIGSAWSYGGSTTIPINPQSPQDVMIVTVTKQNFNRYQATVTIEAPAGACVMYNNHTVNDIAFNGNGVAEYGETVNLNMFVENIGDVTANGVTLSLQTTDNYLTIAQNSAFAGDISQGATSTVNDAFTINIPDNVPNGHNAAFIMTATDAAGSGWTSNFNIEVSSGELTVQTWSLTDDGGDGTLDPGEGGTLNVYAQNTGDALAENILASINTTDNYITILTTDPQSIGSLSAGSNGVAQFDVVASGTTPAGHNAHIDIALIADKGLSAQGAAEIYIGKIPAIVVDLDNLPSSGTLIQSAMQDLGVMAEYTTTLPADLNLYKTVFLCLGIYPDNHTLTTTEGQQLADFLSSGGKLYMEGGDTWAYDPATAVHPMFNITGLSDGAGDLGNVAGIENTFTSDMTFGYSGPNSYIDQLAATGNGFSILTNPIAGYMCGIANEAANYKTIGASFEFGGLVANAATPNELMAEYLTFFGLSGTTLLPPQISVQTESISTVMEKCATEVHTITITNNGEENLICQIEQPVVAWMSVSTLSLTVEPGMTGTFDVTLTGESATVGSYSSTLIITNNDPANSQVVIPVSMELYNPVVSPDDYTVCENDLPFPLEGASPEGGVYHGDYVTDGVFDPSAAGPGAHTVFYTYNGTGGTCEMTTNFLVTVNEAPIVICPEDIAMCGNTLEPVVLSGATPVGGIYSGPGVNDTIFDPAVAGYGVHEITYTYTDPVTGCYDYSSFSIAVDSVQPVTCPENITLCELDSEFTLSGATPAGGVYVYQGDTISTFNPAIYGPGRYRIYYHYNNQSECGGVCSFVIKVYSSPATPSNFTINHIDEMYADLSWDPVTGIRKYYLYYREMNTVDWSLILVNKNQTTFTLEDLQPGSSYETMIQAVSRTCASEMSDTLSFTTLEMPQYCTSGGLDSSDEWIDYVKFPRLSHSSGDDGGYIDNTSLGWGNLYAGRSSSVRFSADRTGSKRTFHWGIWIDFDRDGFFEDEEQIVQTSSNKTNNLRETFFIPNDAHIGITRARVSMKYGGSPGACELFDRGETEDYWVKINEQKGGSGGGDMLELLSDIEEEEFEISSLQCVPNPATDYLLIYYGKMVNNAELTIYNVTGDIVYTETVSGIEFPMHVNSFMPGVYVVTLTTGKKQITSKLIVK